MNRVISNVFGINCTHINTSRIELLDFLRGGAMILVLLHHSGCPYGEYILVFHMPFFFILSGYIEKIRSKNATLDSFKSYVKKRFYRLLIPYYSFEIINLFIWMIICAIKGKTQSLVPALLSIIFCYDIESYSGLLYGRIWFFPCLFVSDIIFWFIRRYANKTSEYVCASFVLLILSWVLSWITNSIVPFRLPYMLDTSLMATTFLILGFIGENIISYLLSKGHFILDCILFIVMLWVEYVACRTRLVIMLMASNVYGNYILTIVAAIGGTILYILLAKYLYYFFVKIPFPFIRKIVLWYGYNTVLLFFVHLDIKCILIQFNCSIITDRWYWLFLTMFILSIPITNILSYCFPILFGLPVKKAKTNHIKSNK